MDENTNILDENTNTLGENPETLEDLYFKYIDSVGGSLEGDRYFQYLYAMVQAGNNVLNQKHQILKKVVDERWIGTIEDSLDAINNIIDKPRRFITTSEEVVPVSLAKKITADSVRHLSMNTQFIASTEEGDVQPTRVLNVTTEESYDLYENRFIYHLIYRLIAFVDKRTDVIFWTTGNETKNVLSMESSVDDAYEEISYKIEMSIKNTQSLVENDNDNMQVFMRIDRIRRLVFALRNSAFFSIMSGCAKVHSPIQRTNLMMKDPDYRTCYKLWQFLESYDDVGYTIEVEDSTLEFDEEYMIQMYTNMITNYTVFKSILESDSRNLTELEKKRRKPIKPKFIREVKEEFVDNRDLPDVEIRRVFLEEVTQAQLDAEEKLAEETKRRTDAEESEAEAQRQMQGLYQQLTMAMSEQAELEDELEKTKADHEAKLTELNGEHERKLTEFRENYEEQLSEQKENYETTISDMKQEHEREVTDNRDYYESRIMTMKHDYEEQIETLTDERDMLVEDAKDNCEKQVNEVTKNYESQIAEMQKEFETQVFDKQKALKSQMAEMQEKYESQIAEIQQKHEDQMSETQQKYETQLSEMQQKYESQIFAMNQKNEKDIADYEGKLHSVKEDSQSKLTSMKQSTDERYSSLEAAHAKEMEELIRQYEERQRQAAYQVVDTYNDRLHKLEIEKEEAVRARLEAESSLEKAIKAQKKAEEKAEGTRLSRYILSNLNGKSHKKDKENEDE